MGLFHMRKKTDVTSERSGPGHHLAQLGPAVSAALWGWCCPGHGDTVDSDVVIFSWDFMGNVW